MINGFSSIIIAVPDLGAARSEYAALLGALPDDPPGSRALLANVAIELVEDPALTAAHIVGLTLWSEDGAGALPENCRGLQLAVSRQRDTQPGPTATGITAVDHVVLRSADADDCIRLFGNNLGLRLALDQAVPEWGGRMLFFRCGKLTLEVIEDLQNPVAADYFWGITYLCEDLVVTLAALDLRGVEHSDIRKGRKPGTRVATIKSHHLGIPTLLIEPASR